MAGDYAARIAFVVELAEHLHAYGTTAQRLEGAINAVASALQLDCEPMSNPTGLILTFSDPQRPLGLSDITRVIRLPPGDTDLAKLCETDRIAEEVMAGRLDIAAGHAALRALERPPTRRGKRAMPLFRAPRPVSWVLVNVRKSTIGEPLGTTLRPSDRDWMTT